MPAAAVTCPRPAGSNAPRGSKTDPAGRILANHWRRCLAHVSTAPGANAATADDPTFEPQCAATAATVAHTQRRADASPGRWAQPGGPADRRVLDVLCEQVVAAVSCDIELDIRRLSHLTGTGRDTARVALHRLAGDGWITPATRPRRASTPPTGP